jgi:hypothetical protein
MERASTLNGLKHLGKCGKTPLLIGVSEVKIEANKQANDRCFLICAVCCFVLAGRHTFDKYDQVTGDYN